MTQFDEQRYAALLASARPRVIEAPEEHDRMLTIAEELMDKGEAMSPEERKLLELLVLLVADIIAVAADRGHQVRAGLNRGHPLAKYCFRIVFGLIT